MKPFLLSFSSTLLLEKAAVEAAKKVRSVGFHMISFSTGCLWWRFMGLYQRLAQGPCQWRAHTFLGCLLWSEWVKARSLTFLHSSSVEARSISASLSKIKAGVLKSVSARLTEVLEPSLPKVRGASTEGKSIGADNILMASPFITSCGNKGLQGTVASYQSPYRASCTACAAKSISQAKHGTQTFNKRP